MMMMIMIPKEKNRGEGEVWEDFDGILLIR